MSDSQEKTLEADNPKDDKHQSLIIPTKIPYWMPDLLYYVKPKDVLQEDVEGNTSIASVSGGFVFTGRNPITQHGYASIFLTILPENELITLEITNNLTVSIHYK